MDADFILIGKMKRGDDEAFDVFVRKYYGEILKYCTYHCQSIESAEDLTQETFCHFFAKLPFYHHRGKTKNFLYVIAGNLCRDLYKKRKMMSVPGSFFEIGDCAIETPMESVVSKLTIEWALKQLPEELREVIILYYFQGLKLSEIADTLQIGLSLVKYRLKQARAQLQKLMREEAGAYES